MPAPALIGSRGPLTLTYVDPTTNEPLLVRGFRINATISSASEGADWVISVTTQLRDSAVVDSNDQGFRFSSSTTLPANENTQADAVTLMQSLVDEAFDKIPSPTP